MLALSSAIEPLRSANRTLGREAYTYSVLATRIGPVRASNGLEIRAEFDLESAPDADLTIIVASLELDGQPNRALSDHIRRLRRHGRGIGAISNGTLPLAEAGVLAGRKVTVHWEGLDRLTDKFPGVTVVPDLFCIDDNIYTASGGSSAMDMMLALITSHEGRSVAADVSDQFLHGIARPAQEVQRDDLRWRYKITDKRLEKVVRLMDAHQADPIGVAQLADHAGLSERQLERLFIQQLGNSPSKFYLRLRLEAARNRLLATTDSLEEIADRSGFSSQGHFSRTFKSWWGVSPKSVRKQK